MIKWYNVKTVIYTSNYKSRTCDVKAWAGDQTIRQDLDAFGAKS